MVTQLSMIPGEDELNKLLEEREDIRSQVKPLLQVVKAASKILGGFSKECEPIYFDCNGVKAAYEYSKLALDQNAELGKATLRLNGLLYRQRYDVEPQIAELLRRVNEATNGEYAKQRPELFGRAPKQLEAQADELLKEQEVDPETGQLLKDLSPAEVAGQDI